MFLVERTVKALSPEDRARARREHLEDKLSKLRAKLQQWSTTTRPSSPMGKAITYALNQWSTLVVFLADGAAPPHNNTSERLLRKPVIGRKNWLFAGSEGGAHAAAVHFSIVLSCELAGVAPLVERYGVPARRAGSASRCEAECGSGADAASMGGTLWADDWE